MGNKMLIDATHPEETRVVVLRGHRVEEFDYESASRKQLRGNIYLAKVTRVEPSLQAAFVNYGGNRHGFLAFSEIHPDYYQLPMAERQALKQEEARLSRHGSFDQDEGEGRSTARSNGARSDEPFSDQSESDVFEGEAEAEAGSRHTLIPPVEDEDDRATQVATLEASLPPSIYSPRISEADESVVAISEETEPSQSHGAEGGTIEVPPAGREAGEMIEEIQPFDDRDVNGRDLDFNINGEGDEHSDMDIVESVGSEDALEELPQRNRRRRRTYKIQEVIKRGQILLVQVVKEERGNKGAALTTYLSLAGRYTVLMPNTASGGGISRKISSPSDRKRLREIAGELDVDEGMGLIIRTAGAARTKTEVKRDYEYLLRLWENVRDLTLHSTAPCLVYEEGDLIKRSIRDLYNREIDEVLVAGDDAYRDAKDFMRMLMPSHAKNVQPYKEPEPLFTRYEVERQLNAMFSPQVTLPSGGYIIINQTEALVAVDVNSGKSTREYSIEDTALKTNLEASEEISRQLRLRDLSGLIVIDFIDMEEKRNNRAVERKLKDCLRNDRARIQVGRISHFGLMEMSRQRIRTGMVEGSTTPCPHCQGTGFVRSTESVSLSVLRSLEDWLRTNSPCNLNAVTSAEAALYILNQKRTYLRDIEARHNVVISVTASDRMHGANFFIEKVSTIAAVASGTVATPVSQSDRIIQPFETESGEAEDDQARRSRHRRRRKRGRDEGDQDQDQRVSLGPAPFEDKTERSTEDGAEEETRVNGSRVEAEAGEDNDKPRRRSRRRGRRGGRQQRGARAPETITRQESETSAVSRDTPVVISAPILPAAVSEPVVEDQPYREDADILASKTPKVDEIFTEAKHEVAPDHDDTRSFRSQPKRKPSHAVNGSGKHNGQSAEGIVDDKGSQGLEPDQTPVAALEEASVSSSPKPKGAKRGWWQRRSI